MAGDGLLGEQIAYYKARAPEYDDWWERRNRYALAPDDQRQWDEEKATLERWLDERLAPYAGGPMLELACGTGNWTRRLAGHAGDLTAVDASTETIGIARSKLVGGGDVRFVEADIFGWRPPGRFDVVFFAFWISHVPPDRFEEFWDLVAASLNPGGVALLMDTRWNDGIWPQAASGPGAGRPRDFVQVRNDLSSGEEHRVVKIYYEPDELAGRLEELGWRPDVTATPRFFVYGTAGPPQAP